MSIIKLFWCWTLHVSRRCWYGFSTDFYSILKFWSNFGFKFVLNSRFLILVVFRSYILKLLHFTQNINGKNRENFKISRNGMHVINDMWKYFKNYGLCRKNPPSTFFTSPPQNNNAAPLQWNGFKNFTDTKTSFLNFL